MIAPLQNQGGFPTTPLDATPGALGSSAPEPSPIDLARLMEVSDDDPEQLREMVDLYLDESQSLMRKLAAAIQDDAAKEIENVAHQFKGASSSCGMTAVVPALQDLERMGKSGQLSGAAQAYAQADHCLGQIKTFLSGHLRNLR